MDIIYNVSYQILLLESILLYMLNVNYLHNNIFIRIIQKESDEKCFK